MLVLDWVQTLQGCLYPVSTSTLRVFTLTFSLHEPAGAALSLQLCPNVQSQFSTVGSPGDAQGCAALSCLAGTGI